MHQNVSMYSLDQIFDVTWNVMETQRRTIFSLISPSAHQIFHLQIPSKRRHRCHQLLKNSQSILSCIFPRERKEFKVITYTLSDFSIVNSFFFRALYIAVISGVLLGNPYLLPIPNSSSLHTTELSETLKQTTRENSQYLFSY